MFALVRTVVSENILTLRYVYILDRFVAQMQKSLREGVSTQSLKVGTLQINTDLSSGFLPILKLGNQSL